MELAVNNILARESATSFTVDIKITNMNNPGFIYSPLWVDTININQNFSDNFADEIYIDFQVSPYDYMQIFNNAKGLIVNLRFVHIDPTTMKRIFNPKPTSKTYKALLMNPVDLLKKFTPGHLMPTDRSPLTEQKNSLLVPVKLWLIEDSAYTLRQQKFSGNLTKVTLSDAIHYVAHKFNIKQVYITPPDNTLKWEHIIFPPYKGLNEIFDYLQETYGVYMKGIDWYYTNNTLYIYPAYENNPSIPYIANIYHIGKNMYSGLGSYHYLPANNLINIISTTVVHTQDISQAAAEEDGNAYSFLRSSTVIDNYTTTTKDGTFVNNNNSLTVGTKVDRMASQNALHLKYSKPTDNIHHQNSKLAKWDAVLIKCGWVHVVPFLLVPGHNIKYYFDKNGIFSLQQGILESVSYHLKPIQKLDTGYTYGGSADLQIRADSDIKTMK